MPGWMPRRENTWALWTRMTGWTGGCSRACLAPLKRMMRTLWCAVAGNSWKKTVWPSMRAAGPRMMNFIRRNRVEQFRRGSAWCRCVGSRVQQTGPQKLGGRTFPPFCGGLEGRGGPGLPADAAALRTPAPDPVGPFLPLPQGTSRLRHVWTGLAAGRLPHGPAGHGPGARFWQRHGLLEFPAVFGWWTTTWNSSAGTSS